MQSTACLSASIWDFSLQFLNQINLAKHLILISADGLWWSDFRVSIF